MHGYSYMYLFFPSIYNKIHIQSVYSAIRKKFSGEINS